MIIETTDRAGLRVVLVQLQAAPDVWAASYHDAYRWAGGWRLVCGDRRDLRPAPMPTPALPFPVSSIPG